jgi:hypothetical protein
MTDQKPANKFAKFRHDQDFASNLGVKKVLTLIPKRKPNKHEFFRAHKEFEFASPLLEIQEPKDLWLVVPELWDELASELKAKILVPCINRNGDIFIWPLNEPDSNRPNSWTESAVAIIPFAKEKWLKVLSNQSTGTYEQYISQGYRDEPEWPEMDLEEMLELAFKDRIIDDINHIVIQKLRGLI